MIRINTLKTIIAVVILGATYLRGDSVTDNQTSKSDVPLPAIGIVKSVEFDTCMDGSHYLILSTDIAGHVTGTRAKGVNAEVDGKLKANEGKMVFVVGTAGQGVEGPQCRFLNAFYVAPLGDLSKLKPTGSSDVTLASGGGNDVPVPFLIAPKNNNVKTLDLSKSIPFIVYAAAPVGGPKKPSEKLISSADDYRKWLGDIDPGFNPVHNHLDGVDFSKEVLIAIGLGDVNLGTSISVDSIQLVTEGIMGGQAFVSYTVKHPTGIHTQIVGAAYMVVKCDRFSGFAVHFLRRDS